MNTFVMHMFVMREHVNPYVCSEKNMNAYVFCNKFNKFLSMLSIH